MKGKTQEKNPSNEIKIAFRRINSVNYDKANRKEKQQPQQQQQKETETETGNAIEHFQGIKSERFNFYEPKSIL